jgi:type II secretory pathway pseudopilin PulG
MRIRTIMVAVVIVGLATALLVRDWQAQRLQARLQVLEAKSSSHAYRRRVTQELFLETGDRAITDDAASDSLHESNP